MTNTPGNLHLDVSYNLDVSCRKAKTESVLKEARAGEKHFTRRQSTVRTAERFSSQTLHMGRGRIEIPTLSEGKQRKTKHQPIILYPVKLSLKSET